MTTPEQYAQAVRDALAEHPEREELLEDLDDHLAEIAAESDVPLEERLGPPAAYAEELVAAYGGRPAAPPRRSRERLRERFRSAHAALMRTAPYRGIVEFLPDLRPGWWVLRGYAVGMLILAPFTGAWVVPDTPLDWLVVALGVWVSVWFGRRSYGRMGASLLVLVNVAASLIVLTGLFVAADGDPQETLRRYGVDDPATQAITVSSFDGQDFYNIKPYAKDGTPLTDVYLYDQDGKPITTSPENFGYKVDRTCGEPVLNRYPLALVEEPVEEGVETAPSACPSATPSATPTEAATPVPTKTR